MSTGSSFSTLGRKIPKMDAINFLSSGELREKGPKGNAEHQNI
jgi:hypothetical protein